MAIFHLNAKVISRAQGRSATAACAYRAGEKITDDRTGQVFDYTRKKEVVYRQIFAPKNAPAWTADRSRLWNEAEQKEGRKDAQVAREIEVSLPVELSLHQQTLLLERYVQTQFVKLGMVADVCIHNKPGNPHAHILLSTREISPAGFGPKNRDWNSKEQLEKWRFEWASHTNRRLMISGFKTSIDSRSLQAQGIDRVPTVHIGPTGTAMQAKGLPVIALQLNHLIKENNMNEIKKATKPASNLLKAVRKFSNFLSMPTSTERHIKDQQESSIFDADYLAELEDLFAQWAMTYDRQETEIGTCLAFNLHPGAVRDYGSQMSCNNGTPDEIKAMVLLAKLKGWKGMHLTGSNDFKEKVFVHAVLTGAYKPEEITGYTPCSRALEIVEMAGKGPSHTKPQEEEKNQPAPQATPTRKLKI